MKLALTVLIATLPAICSHAGPGDWPSFRGLDASGRADGHATVAEFDLTTGRNIRWTTPIPGLAHSSPVIAGNRLFVTTALRKAGDAELKVGLYGSIDPVEDDSPHEMRVVCLDKATGEVLWDQLAIEAVPKVKRHPKGSHAASTPATDGRHVVAFFGSEGLYCYNMDGVLQWSRDFGVLDSGYFRIKDNQWGFASSPVIHENRVIVQCDIHEGSFVAALDLETGKDIWRTERREVPTWSTPAIVESEGRKQIVCNGWKQMAGYDYETGKELWTLDGGGDIPVPTPIVSGGLVYLTNAHGRMAPIIALDVGAKGKLRLTADDEHIAWYYPRRGNYMQTPIVYDDLIYFCSDAGIVSCYEAISGEEVFRSRLGSGGMGFTASPVAADGKLYYTSEYGDVFVLSASREFTVLAQNDLEIESMATPAISEGVIYWRTRNGVVAVGSSEHDSP